MHSFTGTLRWRGETHALGSEQLLLRGCKLRNTNVCYGLVIYAGECGAAIGRGRKAFPGILSCPGASGISRSCSQLIQSGSTCHCHQAPGQGTWSSEVFRGGEAWWWRTPASLSCRSAFQGLGTRFLTSEMFLVQDLIPKL